MTDTGLKSSGLKLLAEKFGEVDAERSSTYSSRNRLTILNGTKYCSMICL
jgi:hypothetical protein